MSLHSGSRLPTSIVHNIDPFNVRKTGKDVKNLLDLTKWTLGTGGTTNFGANGTVDENSRIIDTNPFGIPAVVWQGVKNNDGISGGDGGWNSSFFDIDTTKIYRFSTWVRRKDIQADGRFYLGIRSASGSTSFAVLRKNDTSVESTNFYFTSPRFSDGNMATVSIGDWVLVVAHCWPIGSPSGGNHQDSGIYNTNGARLLNVTDCVMKEGTDKLGHRSYLYGSSVPGDKQQWYLPRVDVCDGTEPSLQDLLDGFGSGAIKDPISGSSYFIQNCATPVADNPPRMPFDGIDDRLHFPTTHSYTEDSTIEVVFNVDTLPTDRYFVAGYRHTPGYGQPPIGSIYIQSGTIRASVITTSQTYRTVIGPTVQAGEVYCVHLVKDTTNGILSLYVNGSLASSISFDAATYAQWPTAGVYVGQNVIDIGKASNETQSWGGSYLKGNIFLFRLYGEVISETDIRKNFESIRTRYLNK